MPIIGPGLLAAVGAATAITLRRRIAERRPAIEQVRSDLRSPALYLSTDLTSNARLRFVRTLLSLPVPKPPAVSVTDQTAVGRGAKPDVPVVVYQPANRTPPSGALLWIHGGGMVLGHPKQGHGFCSRAATELGLLVISVDYRLAPEDPFPAGLDDCCTALDWLHRTADDLGVDPDRIAVGGDSAGGGLAAAVAQVSLDGGTAPVRFQLLVYPMIDDRTALCDDHHGRGTFMWTPASNRFAWTSYLGHLPTQREDRPYAAPAQRSDLRGLAPAWIGVGDLDLFFAEDVEYAKRLEEAGVRCELHVEPGMYHGADSILTKAPSMRAFRDRMIEALRSGLTI